MKKILVLLLTILLILSVVPKQTAAAGFPDVPSSHRFYEDIMYLLQKEVITSSNRFGIEDYVTREEVAVMVGKARGLSGGKVTTPFKDVPSSLASSGYINSAYREGIIQGFPDGTFRPKEIVTRGQMAIFLSRAFGMPAGKTVNFKDMSPKVSSYNAVNQILAANITTGFPDNTFRPNEKLRRGQIAAFLSRAIQFFEVKVHFINVGQGDSILIQSPNGKNMLIDGGTKSAGTKVVSFIKSKGITKLDYVVATHPDADHIGGLISVLNSFPVGTFIDSGKSHTTETYYELLNLIDVKNIPFKVPTEGEEIALDKNFNLQVLNAAKASDDTNEASLVLNLTYNKEAFLFMGDADTQTEADLVARYDLKSTVLKAGHHGSSTSTSQLFVNEVKPATTILSYGKDNSYGHPHSEVVNRLKAAGSKIFNTVDHCDISVLTSGFGHTVSNTCTPTTTPPPATSTAVKIVSKDLSTEIVGIKNTGSTTVNITDWTLVSVNGNQTYKFPSYNLAAGKTVYVTSGPNAKSATGYLKWTTANIWLNSGDPAKLLNAQGAVVSELQ